MTTVYGVMDKTKYMECICNKCERIQWELKTDDKFAWRCRSCGTVNEGDDIHLLEKCCNPWYEYKGAI